MEAEVVAEAVVEAVVEAPFPGFLVFVLAGSAEAMPADRETAGHGDTAAADEDTAPSDGVVQAVPAGFLLLLFELVGLGVVSRHAE